MKHDQFEMYVEEGDCESCDREDVAIISMGTPYEHTHLCRECLVRAVLLLAPAGPMVIARAGVGPVSVDGVMPESAGGGAVLVPPGAWFTFWPPSEHDQFKVADLADPPGSGAWDPATAARIARGGEFGAQVLDGDTDPDPPGSG